VAEPLADALIKRLPVPAKGNRITYDDAVAGFGARVTANGHRGFILNYRTKAGRERRITIGEFPNWTTGAARIEARRLKQLVDRGGDPLADIVEQRQAPTVADLCDRFTQEHLPRRRHGTAVNYKILIDKHILPSLKDRKVAEVGYADIDRLHRQISRDAPYAANRTVAVLSKMFSLAIRWQIRDDNPTKTIERNPENERKRYLSGDELTRLIKALSAHPDRQAADIIRVLLLTGARRGEVLSMRWADIDVTAGTWTKPASTTKQKKEHIVPLSAPTRQLLAEIAAKQKKPLGTFVFPSNGESGHVVEIKRAWRTLTKTADITGLRIHDLRHSFASQLASGGASLPLIGALLGHSSPSTTARYAHLFQDPQRAAAEKVGAVIAAAGKDAEAGEDVVETFPEGGRRGR
jgi:integrase